MEIIKNNDGAFGLTGDLNIFSVREFKLSLDKVLEDKPSKIRLDLSKVTDIDTSCIQILLSLKKLAKSQGIDYKLLNPSGVVKEAFRLAGMLKKE